MPLEVPENPKVYTTKYQNWRGVDYTNDASNVWYRRSPNGLNMLPNLDGQPFKRSGWKIEFTPAEFREAMFDSYDEFDASTVYLVGDVCKRTVDEVEQLYTCKGNSLAVAWDSANWTYKSLPSFQQYKVDYFELNGANYLWFYTSYGCFYYADELVYVSKSFEVEVDGYSVGGETVERPAVFRKWLPYRIGEYCYTMSGDTMHFHRCMVDMETVGSDASFDPSNWYDVEEEECWKPFPPAGMSPDHARAFFFEGGGRAGYYFFCDKKLYWFGVHEDENGDEVRMLHEAHPYIPIVLTMCDANGVGTMYETTNMLTEWRGMEYTCAGGTARTFKVPSGFKIKSGVPIGVMGVYLKNATGGWSVTNDWRMDNPNEIYVTTDNPPPERFEGQTNLKIVFKPDDSVTVTEKHVKSSTKKMKVTKTTTRSNKQVYRNGRWEDSSYDLIRTTVSYATTTQPTFSLSSPKKPYSTYVKRYAKNASGQWSGNLSSIDMKFTSYGKKVTLSGANGGKTIFEANPSIKSATTTTTSYKTLSQTTRRKYVTTKETKSFTTKIEYDQWKYTATKEPYQGRNAFFSSTKSLVYGNGIINQVFLTAATQKDYTTRVWYSMSTRPSYFPDTNYIEVGSTDKAIMGLIKVGDYLGIIKQGGATETSIYLAYPTSFEEITTYAVKQSVNGIGAISNGAFNILNDEPLFLSAEGVMAIEPAEDDSHQIRSRSYYINKPLLEEPALESAFSFVYNGMYWLGINNHCYVLDGNQKISWENTKTNLQYECYYLDNIPAKCFAKKDGLLWFIDTQDNVCRFKGESDEHRYVDDYIVFDSDSIDVDLEHTSDAGVLFLAEDPENMRIPKNHIGDPCVYRTDPLEWNDALRDSLYESGITYTLDDFKEYDSDIQTIGGIVYFIDIDDEQYTYYHESPSQTAVDITIPPEEDFFNDIPEVQESAEYTISILYYAKRPLSVNAIVCGGHGDTDWYTIIGFDGDDVLLGDGVPVTARWGTIADDDGSAHYYKKLQKKGSLVALMPMSDSGVKAYIIPDEKDAIYVGETDAGEHILPFNYYLRKKVKKYKRLQIVCENAGYNDGFGIDEIIKSYIVGNYAKK